MASSQLCPVSLLLFSVLSFNGITMARNIDTNISTKGNWRPTLDNSFLGSVSTSHQASHNHTCFPESWNKLIEQEIISAQTPKCSPVKILLCYCLTPVSKSSDVDNGLMQNMTFGKCLYGCYHSRVYYKFQLEQLENSIICSEFNRRGIICGQCKDGYGPAVYSFSLKCVECGNSTHWTRVPLYILIAYGPLTVFLGVIVVFTVSVNSAPLRGWILVCQLMSSNIVMRVLVQSKHPFLSNIFVNHIYSLLTCTMGSI